MSSQAFRRAGSTRVDLDGHADSGRPPITAAIQSVLPNLTRAERRVAEQLIDDPAAASGWTITELAQRAHTSATTVTRLCRSLDLPGYPELRLTLAAEGGAAQNHLWAKDAGDLTPKDPLDEVVASVLNGSLRALQQTAAQLDLGQLQTAVSVLVRAGRVDVYGVGASSLLARDFQTRLRRIGLNASNSLDIHEALVSAAQLGRGDVAVGVSHSGAAKETVEVLSEARGRGAHTIAITNHSRSPIADVAELMLTTSAHDRSPLRESAMIARHAPLLILDCLFIGVAQRTYTHARRRMEAAALAVESHSLRPRRQIG
ncbi:MAG: MurR/RpiR family transcriptional regulator [Candidatus Dormibacteraeota bacterium]|uniref:MurR/RpiR family transcriptional regulator n=1 Tax=Candidatus Dormiibacter inghamiae TaxID=3127013 RepID=A0A934KF67_9BACT|nr:MurR/RpiR family transcriptional regulator [Candidatus Dormibacteraeota bacterium]MBJ7604874.1 MurR/RpiR family transcriptional regulator [Candidatus Dormibacteraeota bacterium]